MYTIFYSNIYEFSGYLEIILDEGTYKTLIQNIHTLGWKENYFKSADVSMLVHGCGVSQYPQFYDRTKKYIKCYHAHMWEDIHLNRIANFFKRIGFFH